MEDTYTHKDLARLCSVSETTVKSYRRKFPNFIDVAIQGKPIRFHKSAGDVCLKIRDCFNKGMSVKETDKVLKENFKEHRVARTKRSPGKAPQHTSTGTVSEDYLEKFFETAGQMMHGMAQLATSQAQASRRLQNLEKAMQQLIDIETQNSKTLESFLQMQTQPTGPTVVKETPAKKSKPRPARKIVNVRSSEGDVTSYSLEENQTPDPAQPVRPDDTFLNTPIVILNDTGDFLGVPGRLPLSRFIEVLIQESEESDESLLSWRQADEDWIFEMKTTGDESHDLYFSSTTTPRGNIVVLFGRLDVNGKRTSQQFLQEFFRQVKDKI